MNFDFTQLSIFPSPPPKTNPKFQKSPSKKNRIKNRILYNPILPIPFFYLPINAIRTKASAIFFHRNSFKIITNRTRPTTYKKISAHCTKTFFAIIKNLAVFGQYVKSFTHYNYTCRLTCSGSDRSKQRVAAFTPFSIIASIFLSRCRRSSRRNRLKLCSSSVNKLNRSTPSGSGISK